MTFLIVIGIAALVYNVWNTIVLKNFFKTSFRREQINDQKYWELKYKIQSLVTIFVIIVGIGGYLGISTVDDLKKSISKELKPQLDSATVMVASLKDTLNTYKDVMQNLKSNSEQVSSSLKMSKGSLEILTKTINEINRKNKIQSAVYVVNDIPVNTELSAVDKQATFYFADFATASGDKLPIFTKPPNVIVVSNNGSFAATHVTTTSLRLTALAYTATELNEVPQKFIKVSIIIIQNP
jgi:hypothetical protein